MVTVIVAYDRDRGWLKECIDSIEAQTYKDIEIIQVHNPLSCSENFNIGLKKAKGEFVKWVDEDDWIPETAVQDLIDGIEGHPWVCANAILCETNEVYKPDLSKLNLKDMRINNVVHGGATLYRTDLLREIGGMDETLWTGEEYDMNMKLMSMGKMPAYIDKVVNFYRDHNQQKSKTLRWKNPDRRKQALIEIRQRYEDIST